MKHISFKENAMDLAYTILMMLSAKRMTEISTELYRRHNFDVREQPEKLTFIWAMVYATPYSNDEITKIFLEKQNV
jgi:hypothetical protein